MISQAFVDGFAEVCAEVGLTEKQAASLLEVATVLMDMRNADYAEGFNSEVTKAAGFAEAPDLTGAFSAPDSTIAKGVSGAGAGALLGGALGLGAILRPSMARRAGGLLLKLNHNGKPFFNMGAARRFTPVLDRAALKGALPTGANIGDAVSLTTSVVPKYESRLRTYARRMMGPNNSRVLGGAAAGAAVGAPLNAHFGWLSGYGSNVPTMDHWLPDVLDGAYPGQQATQAGQPSTPSMFNPLPSFTTGAAAGGFVGGAPSAQGATVIDQQMAQLQSQLVPPGTPEAALNNNRIRRQLADLERARVRQYADASIAGGAHRSNMASAGGSIADKLQEVEKAISDRESRAGNANAWLERTGGPTTLANMVPQAWNKLTGNEAGLRQITAELQQLYRMRSMLNSQLAAAGQNQ